MYLDVIIIICELIVIGIMVYFLKKFLDQKKKKEQERNRMIAENKEESLKRKLANDRRR
jgi:C4-dicarboxylate transporter